MLKGNSNYVKAYNMAKIKRETTYVRYLEEKEVHKNMTSFWLEKAIKEAKAAEDFFKTIENMTKKERENL